MSKASAKIKTTENKKNTETITKNGQEIIEVDWDKVSHVFEFREKLLNLENYFANSCLQFEKNKANMMNQIMYGQADLYTMAQAVQKELNIDESLTYELKLPTNPGEKGYFVRKEDSHQQKPQPSV